MNSDFFEASKKVANDFLQSIVFIDDQAFIKQKRNNNEFDALQISQSFAKKQKICSVYRPETEEDIDNIAQLAKKSDIAVIDWQILLSNGTSQGDEEIKDEILEEEEDEEEDDPRGPHTKKIISEILSDQVTGKENLKLILIYTGETSLYDVTDSIYEDLKSKGFSSIQKADCKIFTDSIKILIIAKPSVETKEGDPKFKYNPELKEKVVTYEDLPDFILNEFTNMTQGLLSNFTLKALTEIKRNSYKLLNLFSKKLDIAYLSHKSLLPIPDDSQQLLIDILSDSLRDLLKYAKVDSIIDKDFIKKWANNSIQSERMPIVNKRGTQVDNKAFERTFDFIEQLLVSSEPNVEKRYKKAFENFESFKSLTKEQKADFLKYIAFNNISLFSNLEDTDTEESNKKFAILTHHKSLFKPSSIIPKLDLGTVIKGIKTSKYWICIQQKCDSVRIFSKERKFLFLPLVKVDSNRKGKFDIITPDGSLLKLMSKSYSIRTIKFIGDDKEGVVLAEKDEDNFVFKQLYSDGHDLFNQDIDEDFEWIFDLKDLHAQRIASNYATQLSRVGLDESEWLRRWSTN